MSQTRKSKGLQKAQGMSYPLHKRLFNLEEAAVYLGRPVFSVRGLIWRGALPYVKDGRRQYIDIVDLEAYIERNKHTMI